MPDRIGVLRRDHQQDIAEVVGLRMPRAFHPQSEAAGQRARRARGLIGNLMRSALETEARHHALFFSEAALDMQRFPWAALLVFGKTAGVLAGRAEGRTFDFAGTPAPDVAHNQL